MKYIKIQKLSLLLAQAFIALQVCAHAEQDYVAALASYRSIPRGIQKFLYSLATPAQPREIDMSSAHAVPLYCAYPNLFNTLPYLSLGSFPTPVYTAPSLAQEYEVATLYIKDDGATGGLSENNKLFGGNKVRKLEFLLADAWKLGAKSVLTFGCIGSNHAVATATYAHQLGLQPLLILKSQPASDTVQRNLALMHHNQSAFYYAQQAADITETAIQACLERKHIQGDFPYIIPTGGSCPRGAIGYVNAMFELKNQIEEGILEEPDYIYVAAGSLGTLAGMMVGKRATGIRAEVIGVCTEGVGSQQDYKNKLITLAHDTSELLNALDSSFESMDFDESDVIILHQFCGERYGQFTDEGRQAAHDFFNLANVTLDGTYTAKAAAGMKADIKARQLHDKKILFWNTFCGESFKEELAAFDHKSLPEWAHAVYEQPAQSIFAE